MKPNRKSPLLAAALLIFASHAAQAATFTWDGNNNTANFGSASGTWATPTTGTATAGWTTDATGATVVAGNSVTTATNDDVFFGTNTTSRGLGSGTITVSGTVNVRSITFGSQTTGNVILSGGTINIGAGSTISVGAGGGTVQTIASSLTGSNGFTKGGNTLALSGTNSGLTGTVNVTSGSLIFRSVAAKTGGTMAFSSGTTLSLGVGGAGFFDAADVTNAFAGTISGNLTNITLNSATNIGIDTTSAGFIYGDTIGSVGRGLVKDGANTLTLTGANSYTGTTNVRGGTLRLENLSAISATTGLTVGSGTSLSIGTASAFTSSAPLTMTGGTIISDRLNTGGGFTHVLGGLAVNNATQTFAAGSNVNDGNAAIQIGNITNSSGADGTAGLNATTAKVFAGTYTSLVNAGFNNLNLSGSTFGNTIGVISNGTRVTQNVAKQGTGLWIFTGANTYNGTTTVSGGVLQLNDVAAISGGIGATGGTNSIILSGGILGLGAGNFSRTVGLGTNQIQLTGNSSGFAAYNANREVDLGAALTWGTDYNQSTFVLSHSTATHTVDFKSGLTMAASGNRFLVVNNGAADVDAVVSGQISGGSGTGLSKGGEGVLVLTNTNNNWVGQTYIDSGTLRLGASEVIPELTLTVKRANGNIANGVFDIAGFNEKIGALNLGETGTTSGNSGQTPSVINSLNDSAVLTLGGTVTYNPGAIGFTNGQATISANVALGGAAAATRDFNVADSVNATTELLVSGNISDGPNSNGLSKNGSGLMAIRGTNTYTGNTTINGGTLAISGSGTIANTPLIQINSSTTLDVTGLAGPAFNLGAAQTLTGPGSIVATGKTLNVAGTLAPGASPGALTQDGGSMQLAVGGDYNWQILNASAPAGTGYDTTSLVNSASLDLSQLSAGSIFNINLWSLSATGPDVNGNATNFDNTLAYSWTLFSTGTAISGFSTDKFTINTGAFNGTNGFSNDLGGGAFSVGLADADTDLVLQFTPIPEPNVAALLGSLGTLALFRRRRN